MPYRGGGPLWPAVFVVRETGQLALNRPDLPGQISRVHPNNALFNPVNRFRLQQTTIFEPLPRSVNCVLNPLSSPIGRSVVSGGSLRGREKTQPQRHRRP